MLLLIPAFTTVAKWHDYLFIMLPLSVHHSAVWYENEPIMVNTPELLTLPIASHRTDFKGNSIKFRTMQTA